jgi:hypothetical protein
VCAGRSRRATAAIPCSAGCDRRTHSRHQPADPLVGERPLGDRAVDRSELLVGEIDLPEAALDRVPLVGRQLELFEPRIARAADGSLTGERSRLRCSVAWISFFARQRCRTS